MLYSSILACRTWMATRLPGGCAAAEQSPSRKHRTTIIAITGHHRDAERLQSYAVGMDLHLIKPVEWDELLRILERLQAIRCSLTPSSCRVPVRRPTLTFPRVG